MQEIGAPPGRGRPALRFLAFAAVFVLVAVAAGVVVFRNGAALTVLRSVAHGFGYDVTAGNLDVNAAEAIARDVRIRNAAGEPVLEATRIDVGYSLRDLLPGGKRLYGLTSIDVETPHLTVVHHRDGTYNITIPPSPSKSPAPNAVPLDVRLHVTNGMADLVDQFVSAPRERRARLSAVHAEGAISPAAASYYHAGAVLE